MTVLGTDRRIIALAIARAADAFGNAFLVVVLPLFIASEAISGDLMGLPEATAIGVALASLGFVNSALQPATGRLSDRWGRRRAFVLAGLALLAVANIAYAWVSSYVAVLGLRALQGIALALTIPATFALISEIATQTTRATSVGAYNTFRLVGYAIGPAVAGLVVTAGPYEVGVAGSDLVLSGFHAAFLTASLSALLGFAVIAWLVRDPGELVARSSSQRRLRIRRGDGKLDPVFTLGLATFCVAISISLIASIENLINARLGQSAAWFGMQFSVFLVPHILLQTPVGRLSDRYGRLWFVVWGLVLVVPATLVQGYVTGPWQMLAARAGQGLATALFFAPGLAMAGDLAETGASGTTLSVVTAAFGLGVATGPLFSGVLVELGFAAPFVGGAVLVAGAAGLAWTQLEETHVDAREPSPDPVPDP